MIPLLAVMMAAYFVARLVSLCTRTGEREEHEASKVVSFLAIIAICVCVYFVFQKSNQANAVTRQIEQQLGP